MWRKSPCWCSAAARRIAFDQPYIYYFKIYKPTKVLTYKNINV
nr:MAG TPA: hypothetical protein [Caudoviricetes sp.]